MNVQCAKTMGESVSDYEIKDKGMMFATESSFGYKLRAYQYRERIGDITMNYKDEQIEEQFVLRRCDDPECGYCHLTQSGEKE